MMIAWNGCSFRNLRQLDDCYGEFHCGPSVCQIFDATIQKTTGFTWTFSWYELSHQIFDVNQKFDLSEPDPSWEKPEWDEYSLSINTADQWDAKQCETGIVLIVWRRAKMQRNVWLNEQE